MTEGEEVSDVNGPLTQSGSEEAVDPGPAKLTRFRARGFFPADFAAVESGKVYASGAYWSVLRFAQFPAVLPMMALVIVVEVPFHAYQADHVLDMGLVDSDSRPLKFHVQGVFRSAPGIEHKYGAPGLVPVAVPIQGLTFERPGDYSFTVAVDDSEIGRYPFTVLHVATLQGPAGQGP
jgi:hypothetical protein